MLKIAVIGGGWYGCHIAAVLLALGVEVDLFEREAEIFTAASGNNQFRLHMGFHYARSHRTRLQSREGYARFMERYPRLTAKVARNIYAVPSGDSSIDFTTYKMIMSAAGIDYREGRSETLSELGYAAIEGFVECDERIILTSRARAYFRQRLGGALHLGSEIIAIEETEEGVHVLGVRYDFVVDTTWGHLTSLPIPCYWEPTLLLYYRGDISEPALTLVDGPLCSVYPTEEAGLFSLSSVPLTPIGQFDSAQAAVAARNAVDGRMVSEKRLAMEAQISRYIPAFRDRFRFEGVQLSIKTKPIGASDDRSCWVGHERRRFTVLSGKIDTIFFAAEAIVSQIERGVEALHQRESEEKNIVAGVRSISELL